MNERQKVTVNFAPGLLSMLTVLFVGLKLGNVIDWPWLWVLSPLWLPISIVIAIFGICCLVMLIMKW